MTEIEWEEIIVESDIWVHENIGDSIQGIYKGKESNVGNWKKNRYELTVDGEPKYIYGTKDLDDKFEQIEVDYEVKIILKEIIPQKAPKKPFKKFQVFKRPAEINEPAANETPDQEDPDPLSENPDDDIKARKIISDITDSLINEKGMDANDIDDNMIRKEAGIWKRKGNIKTKEDYIAVMKQLERKHVKE